jgi:WD40 repeat protein
MNRKQRTLIVFLVIFVGFCWNIAAQDVAVFPQLGHTSGVNSVAFSPDGRQIISGGGDGTIKIWDVVSGRVIRTMHGYSIPVNSVAFSPDGNQIISCSEGDFNDDLKIWDARTGREIRTLAVSRVTSIAFSPDGRTIISNGHDSLIGSRTIKLWDARTGREIRRFADFHAISIVFNPDGNQFASSHRGGVIILWDTATGREIRRIATGHTSHIASIAFSPDGRQLISCSSGSTDSGVFMEGEIKLWDVVTGREIRRFIGHTSGVMSIVFSPDGRQILSSSIGILESGRYRDWEIKLWDTNTGREIRSFSGHSDGVNSVAFSPDGRQLISGSRDNTIKLWDIATGTEIRTFFGSTSSINTVKFNTNGTQFFSGSDAVRQWDIYTGQQIRVFQRAFFHDYSVHSICLSPDGTQLLSGSNYNFVRLLDIASGRDIKSLHGVIANLSVSFTPDGRQILAGGQSVQLWDIASERLIRTASEGLYFSVAFSADGRQSAFSWYSGAITLWDMINNREIIELPGHSHAETIFALAFSPDGRRLLSGSMLGRITLWDTTSGREIITLSGSMESLNTYTVNYLSFSHDGRQGLSGASDGTIKLWDLNTGREIRTFFNGLTRINSVAFSPDGRHIISGASDGTIRLWEVSTGREIAQFISFTDDEWIVITPDGFYSASPNGDRYLNVRVGNNVYGIDQYRNTFFRPQIVEARLQGRPDPVQVATTIQQAGEPPTVVIRNPERGARLTTNQVELFVVVESRQPIRNIQFLVNGRAISGEAVRGIRGVRGVELETTGIHITENQNRLDFRINLQLDPGNNRIEVIANNPHEGRDSVEVFSQQAAAQNILPNLWLLSIGVNHYDSPQLSDLNYAVNDAREIVNVFRAQEGRVYRQVNSRIIADGTPIPPTRENIIDGFDFLRGAGANDVILLFIAGHGLNDENGNFFFMPSDAIINNDGTIRTARAISHREIQSVLDVPGQKLVFIDACHSADAGNRRTRAVDNNRLVRDLASHSTVVFTSSRGNQLSQERSELRHGVFTYAILQGLRGEAFPENGNITISSLHLYVSRRVREITNNMQEPTFSTPDGFSDFRVARVR